MAFSILFILELFTLQNLVEGRVMKIDVLGGAGDMGLV